MTDLFHDYQFERSQLKPRILHIGFGAFARAHPMVFLQEGLARKAGDWGVIAARLNSGVEGLNALDRAGGLYHVAEADDHKTVLRRIGVLCGTCHPHRDGKHALRDLIASDDMSLIMLTITEKAYCLKSGSLDTSHPGIQSDLQGGPPKTAIGVIVEGLAHRRARGGGGMTILSCDNLPENGQLTRNAILGFASLKDPSLAQWIKENICFPSSMVDRICPALTPESGVELTRLAGQEDPNGILVEPFRQWVIEDNFHQTPPPFHAGGALLVPDVKPFEEMKLRMLNGAHTALAWMGQLCGHENVSDCMQDEVLRRVIGHLMRNEQAPTLNLPAGIDLDAYANDLLIRFSNTRLKHRLDQIATDSSQKMPQRLFFPVQDNLTAGREWPVTALAIAAWVHGLHHLPPLPDPAGKALRAAAGTASPVRSVLALEGLLPARLAESPAFFDGVTAAYQLITQTGMQNALAKTLDKVADHD